MGRLQRSCGIRLIEKTNLSFSFQESLDLAFSHDTSTHRLSRGLTPRRVSLIRPLDIYFIVLLLRPAEKYSPYFHIFKHFYAPISIILFYPFHVSQILPPPPRSPTIYSASRFHQPRMSNNCSTNVVVVVVDTSADNLFTNASPISARRFRLRIYKTGKRFKRK